jgi:hypothetical protein
MLLKQLIFKLYKIIKMNSYYSKPLSENAKFRCDALA